MSRLAARIADIMERAKRAPYQGYAAGADRPVDIPETHQEAAQRLVDVSAVNSVAYRNRELSVSREGSDPLLTEFQVAFVTLVACRGCSRCRDARLSHYAVSDTEIGAFGMCLSPLRLKDGTLVACRGCSRCRDARLSHYAVSDTEIGAFGMCLSPLRLKDGTLVACRGCSRCRDARLNDLVGRCVAEQATSTATVAVTLTYAGDCPESVVLRYSDVQLMLKRLRKAGYSVRYICAGEYGSQKGRAHWHIILFFQGKSPDVQFDERIDWKFWPHGFSYFQRPDYRGFRYVMKYCLKDHISEVSVKSIAMSKKPPLGHDFFIQLAADLVERRLPVHSPEYSFAHVRDRKGKARRYWLQGRMREIFLETYVEGWRQAYGEDPPPTDFLMEKFLDPIAKAEMDAEREPIRDEWATYKPVHIVEPFIERVALGYLLIEGRRSGMVIAYNDATAELVIGDREWLLTERRGSVARQLQNSELPHSNIRPVCLWLAEKWTVKS